MTQLDSLYLEIDEDTGEVIRCSDTEKLSSVKVSLDFFNEFNSTYWVFNGTELVLIENAESIRDTALAEEEAAYRTKLFDERKEQLLVKCKANRDAKTYTNETVAFPVDEHEIKTENEIDIRNLMSKMLAATAIIQAGGGAGNYKYTTAAKVQVTMTVDQFSRAGLTIMAIKDAIFYTYEDLRVLIAAATTEAALDTVEGDWPE